MMTSEEYAESLDCHKGSNQNQVQTRLKDLELELTTALQFLRSKKEGYMAKEVTGSSSRDLQKVSDAWEFQENEIMNSQERLRSTRAKLAVLEGKMTLTIFEAQKIVEEKQKRIDGARKALQLLCTVCIGWPNSASEVLLVGSFDGWTTQRKMEKSKMGIFSVYLKLYPGRYEIKFIVDGIWKVDPLRPITHNSKYENNLLIIT
ncbi:5'-AMP-activated protein kinase-related [Forsythia ovata]|uniref:5'-AMP-activated protein kinase-related n=1 Tax=Forsythia ovata TaxID=205694 RepID=A0ABD1WB46_9LAMI